MLLFVCAIRYVIGGAFGAFLVFVFGVVFGFVMGVCLILVLWLVVLLMGMFVSVVTRFSSFVLIIDVVGVVCCIEVIVGVVSGVVIVFH